MQQQCLKRFIGLQLSIAVALVTVVVLAYFVQKSSQNVSKRKIGSSNETAPYYDGSMYTAGDFSPIANGLGSEEETEIDDAEKPLPKEDDFINTIELPQFPLGTTPPLDIDLEQAENDVTGRISEPEKQEKPTNAKQPQESVSLIQTDGVSEGLTNTIGNAPSDAPIESSSNAPSDRPSGASSNAPSGTLSDVPSDAPSLQPTLAVSEIPSDGPSLQPTLIHSTTPSDGPSLILQSQNSALSHTDEPTDELWSVANFKGIPDPTREPTLEPSPVPTPEPTSQPSPKPSLQPTLDPTLEPTHTPSHIPSEKPSLEHSLQPTFDSSYQPSSFPIDRPSLEPSLGPTFEPSPVPSLDPSDGPSLEPSLEPTFEPTHLPGTPQPTPSFDNMLVDFVEGLSEAADSSNESKCPLSHEFSTACGKDMVDEICYYDYELVGCTWNTLSCSPRVECKCESLWGSGQGWWSCKENSLESCHLRGRRDLPPLGESCDPDDPLPEKSRPILDSAFDSSITEEAMDISSECPTEPEFGVCLGYQEGLHCEFDFVYTGCTWDELSCAPAIQCDCSDGRWRCDVDFTEPCDVTINGRPAGGIPWGEECDPNEPIIIPEPIMIPEKKDSCPSTFAFGSCIDYEEDLKCEYNYNYRGCTLDDFECAPSVTCTCEQDIWECDGNFETPCGISGRSEGLPWGKECDPSDEIDLEIILQNRTEAPTPTPSEAPSLSPTVLTMEYQEAEIQETETMDPQGLLSNECPLSFRFGECRNEYVDDLQCSYNHAFVGCTWETLSCEPSIRCKCDHWYGNWECKTNFQTCGENGLSELPVGLPWGEPCDPTAELPTSPP